MTPREIIAEAWAITCREKPLRRWGMFSSFFETLLNLKLIAYQVYFIHAYLAGKQVGFFDDFVWLYDNLPFWAVATIAISFLVLLGIELIVPKFARGAVIGLAAKAYQKEPLRGGYILALYNFFPIFAFEEIFFLSSIGTVVTLTSLILRYMSGDIKFTVVWMLVAVWILTNILKFFASFAEPAIVIRRVGIFEAISQSLKLILSYLGHVMFLWLLLVVISVRIMFNAILALIIPVIVVGISFVLSTFLSLTVTVFVACGICVLLVLVASYFFAYLHVFHDVVWTVTYFELKKYRDLSIIEA